MNGNAMTATRLRLLLIISMVVLAVASSAAFYFIQQRLAPYANEISMLNARPNIFGHATSPWPAWPA